ncbi:MAG: hypothetical protein P8Y45_15730, partial [Exilibacterium sp.]
KRASFIVSSTNAANRSGQRRCSPSRDRLRQGCPKRCGQALPQASPQGWVYGVSLEGLHLL